MSDLPPKEAAIYIQRIYMQLLQPKSYQAIDDFTNEILARPALKRRKEYNDKTNHIRTLIDKNDIRTALNQIGKIIDQYDFLKQKKNTKFILSSEEREIKDKYLKGIHTEETAFNSLKMRVLEFCDEIDNEIDEHYQ
jgi:hypothetical protein